MEIRNIYFAYGDKPIIEDLSFSLSGGRHIAVMGESGRGKTTLLKLLLGQLTPQAGSILREPNERPAVVFQEDRLLPWFTALKNVQLVSDNYHSPEMILSDMELDLKKYPREMSGGMQRRVAIARALAFHQEPFLLDEPFKGLDPDMRERIAAKILEYAEKSYEKPASILLITHDEHEAKLLKCDEIIRL